MKTKRYRCRCCQTLKVVKKKGQKYCGDKRCQQVRKNRWRREKYAEDVDYRLNQRASTEAWLKSAGGAAKYHREYRRRSKEQRRVKELQFGVERKDFVSHASLFLPSHQAITGSANRDAPYGNNPIKAGRYIIFPVPDKAGANRDPIKVEISVISDG